MRGGMEQRDAFAAELRRLRADTGLSLAVFDVPEVAAVDVRVLGEAGQRQPGIGA